LRRGGGRPAQRLNQPVQVGRPRQAGDGGLQLRGGQLAAHAGDNLLAGLNEGARGGDVGQDGLGGKGLEAAERQLDLDEGAAGRRRIDGLEGDRRAGGGQDGVERLGVDFDRAVREGAGHAARCGATEVRKIEQSIRALGGHFETVGRRELHVQIRRKRFIGHR